MIISHKHKYVFVQFPHTACTAVGRELVDYYGGEPFLFKHAAYHDFIRESPRSMHDYFSFSTIRNPLDELLSFYFKLKSNHNGDFTDPSRLRENGGWIKPQIADRFHFVQDNDADFITYLKKYYKMPHVNWSVLDHRRMDYVIRYENLQTDFSELLKRMGLEQVREIPIINQTKKSKSDPLGTLDNDESRIVREIAGPLMEYWGYPPFRSDIHAYSLLIRLKFQYMIFKKSVYWRHVRHRA